MPKSRAWGSGRACLICGLPPSSSVSVALAEAGFEVESAASESEAEAALERRPFAAVFAPAKLEPAVLQGITARAGQRHPAVPVVLLGASATLQDAVDAMQQGAADYVPPPFDGDVLLGRLRRLLDRKASLPLDVVATAPSLEHMGLVGNSAAMRKAYATIEKISRYKTNVLLLGESGSGKELLARALHGRGPRRKHLFVPINCAALGRELLENELFGHERGAFTGANERKKGLFELADGGTLFLDEIGELDPSTQAKLLRVLERNEFRRVGGTTKVKVDLGVIAATNRNLEEAIAAKRFREDLYYRLKVVTIVVPPLRERREDIPALVDAFIADFNRRNDGKIKGIATPAMRRLMELDWPGNVRELKNAIESAAVLATGETIGMDALDSPLPSSGAAATTRRQSAVVAMAPAGSDVLQISSRASLVEVERLLIAEHLSRAKSKTQAARTLGIGLRTLYTKIRAYNLGLGGGGRS